MKSVPEKLIGRHPSLVHSDHKKVLSHVQRQDGDWIINTLVIAGCDAPFRYKRKRLYKSLAGAFVNLTYYPALEITAGIEVEVMRVVRIKRS